MAPPSRTVGIGTRDSPAHGTQYHVHLHAPAAVRMNYRPPSTRSVCRLRDSAAHTPRRWKAAARRIRPLTTSRCIRILLGAFECHGNSDLSTVDDSPAVRCRHRDYRPGFRVVETGRSASARGNAASTCLVACRGVRPHCWPPGTTLAIHRVYRRACLSYGRGSHAYHALREARTDWLPRKPHARCQAADPQRCLCSPSRDRHRVPTRLRYPYSEGRATARPAPHRTRRSG